MSDQQVLSDIRELIYRQATALSAMADQMAALAANMERGLAVPPPTVTLPEYPTPQVTVTSNSAEVAKEVAGAFTPAFSVLQALVEDLKRTTVELSERVAKPPPVVVRGGSQNKVHLIDPATGDDIGASLAKDSTLQSLVDASGGSLVTTLFDYGARTDGNPERIGTAPPGSDEASGVWRIKTFSYDSSARVISILETENQAWS